MKSNTLYQRADCSRVAESARQISEDYAGGDLLVLGILKALLFMADLVREIEGVNLQLDFMSVSSYGTSSESSGEVRIPERSGFVGGREARFGSGGYHRYWIDPAVYQRPVAERGLKRKLCCF